MLVWLAENYATLLICLVLAAILAAAVISIIRDKAKGKSLCGCNCKSCPMGGACRKK